MPLFVVLALSSEPATKPKPQAVQEFGRAYPLISLPPPSVLDGYVGSRKLALVPKGVLRVQARLRVLVSTCLTFVEIHKQLTDSKKSAMVRFVFAVLCGGGNSCFCLVWPCL